MRKELFRTILQLSPTLSKKEIIELGEMTHKELTYKLMKIANALKYSTKA